jgi:hypothetical protein
MSAVENKDDVAAEAEMSVAAAAETGEIGASDAVKPSAVAAAKSVKRECGSATAGESPVPAKHAKTVDTDNGTIARDTATQGPDTDAPEIDEGVYSSVKNGVAASVKDPKPTSKLVREILAQMELTSKLQSNGKFVFSDHFIEVLFLRELYRLMGCGRGATPKLLEEIGSRTLHLTGFPVEAELGTILEFFDKVVVEYQSICRREPTTGDVFAIFKTDKQAMEFLVKYKTAGILSYRLAGVFQKLVQIGFSWICFEF